MNKNTLIIATVTLLLLLTVGAGAIYIIFFAQKEVVSVSSDPFSNSFPFSEEKKSASTLASGNENQGAVGAPKGTIPIRTLDGFSNVRDFTKDADVGMTVEGDAFYITSPSDIALSERDLEYEISYIPDEQRLIAAIFREPIAEVRLKISAELTKRLGVSTIELCALDILVVVPRWANDYYADTNLGFPGCPGAVKFQGD